VNSICEGSIMRLKLPTAASRMPTAFLLVWHAAAIAAGPEPVDFSREIQPLLAKRCVACHGPDTREAGLRLDDRAIATAPLESGKRAIAPASPHESEMLARITSTDPDLQMPPEGPRLTPAQVETIRRWIDEGADWKKHWAFEPVKRPGVPAGDGSANPIDAFVRAGLARRGLPVPRPAEKLALIRRATYDLTGLPPSESDVREFLADESPDAWEKVVDRLLASPHYGEKWARHWLDLVRYADTNSFERDGAKPNSWRYRDYVIRSLNDDKPFDRFVIEQLAGDELPAPSNDALIATGYYRLGLWDDEPADRAQAKYDGLDDIVSTTSQAFLGLTVNCARCHDHKIDPIPQKDYYGLLAFFHNMTPNGYGPNVELPIFDDDAARRAYEEKAADLERRRGEAQKAVSEIEARFRAEWERQSVASAGGDLDDLEFRFYRDTWELLPAFDDLKPEDVGAVPSQLFDIAVAPSLRENSFGYVFTGFLKVPADGDYIFTLDSDDGARLTVDGREAILYDGIHGTGSPKTATVTLHAGRPAIRLEYFQKEGGKGLSVAWSGPGFAGRSLSAAGGEKEKGKKAFDPVKAIAADGARILGAEGKKDYDAKRKQLEKLKKEQVPVDKALVASEHGAKPPETFVFYRGNPHAETTPEQRVEPAFPAVLGATSPEIEPPADGKTSGRRLALARWIASPENPLTSRVLVNRIWQHHFGRGIVRSASNFGTAGDPPTHPELLDWLATECVAGDWRLKPIHRLILTSQAYMAGSAGNPEAIAKDPLNDGLWRFEMRRLTAEEIRDSMHVASGGFNPKMFGPGIYPEMPPEVLAGQSRPGSGWGKSSPEEQARRSIYIHVKRSLVTPILADFDAADTDVSCPVRFVTTQPTQALGMMNGGFAQAQAKRFAERVRTESGGDGKSDTPARIRRAIAIALVRDASDKEVADGVALVDRLAGLEGVGPDRALEIYCLMVLNLNEFAYLD
jgi:mono/diheme cytochrome c family protein